MVANKRFPARP